MSSAFNIPEGFVLVPREVLKAASDSLGSFVSDHGWSQHDMDVMDAIDALLAAAPTATQVAEAPKAAPQTVVGEAMREFLGKLVRTEWVAWAAEQENPKPSWLLSWDDLTEPEREVDRRIGERLWRFGYVRTAPSAAPHQGADALREAPTEAQLDAACLRHTQALQAGLTSRKAMLRALQAAALAQHQPPQQGEQHE